MYSVSQKYTKEIFMKKATTLAVLAVLAFCLVFTSCPTPNQPSGGTGSIASKQVKDFFADYAENGMLATRFYFEDTDNRALLNIEDYSVTFESKTYYFKNFLGNKPSDLSSDEIPDVWGEDLTFSICNEKGSKVGKFTFGIGWPERGWYISYATLTLGSDKYDLEYLPPIYE